MKRKIAAIITAGVLAYSITACGQAQDTADSTVKEEAVTEATEAAEETAEEAITEAEATEAVTGETEAVSGETEAVTEEAEAVSAEKSAAGTVTADAGKSSAGSSANNSAGKSNTGNNSTGSANSSAGSTNNTDSANNAGNAAAVQTGTDSSTVAAHEHAWTEHLATGHYEEQVVTAAYDEPVYETVSRSICNVCGEDTTGYSDSHMKEHALAGEGGGYHAEYVTVQTGTVHHDAVTQTVWVEEAEGWYECSICGERSIMASHNHN